MDGKLIMEIIKDTLHGRHYTAPDGYYIVCKADHSIYTTSLWVGYYDTIDNYELVSADEIEKENEKGDTPYAIQ